MAEQLADYSVAKTVQTKVADWVDLTVELWACLKAVLKVARLVVMLG